MESILNLLWLLVTAVIAGTWIFQGHNRHRWLRPGPQALALACAAIFLFPVISATDDLQATVLAGESNDGKQNLNKFTANGPHPSATGNTVLNAAMQSDFFTVVDSGIILIDSQSSSAPSPISFPGPLGNRPPPSRQI
jgi:hypothetical protein